jgi:pimeloyl-ACP methyl ester carboxylesterase
VRTHPARTERLLLDSTLRLEGGAAVDVDPFTAGRRIVGRLCAGVPCPGVRGLKAKTARLSRILAGRAIPAVTVGSDGRAARIAFGGPRDASALIDTLQNGDLTPGARAAFAPGVIAALRGDASLLARAAAAGGGAPEDPSEFSSALFLTTSCEETVVPWTSAESAQTRKAALLGAVGAVPAPALAPFGRSQAAGYGAWAVCFGWPEADLYRPPAGGIPDSVPTLILSGADDVRTPVESARSVADQSPSASLVVVPNRGHSLLTQGDPCVEDASRRFFSGERVPAGICADVERLVDPYPVPPARLGDLAPARGYGGRVGRTLTAVSRTLGDIDPSLQLAPDQDGDVVRTTGLRAGRLIVAFRAAEVRAAMRGFTYVPGVSLSGDLRFGFVGATARSIQVSGSAAARGRLRLSGAGLLTGTLDGRRIRARITPSGAVRVS